MIRCTSPRSRRCSRPSGRLARPLRWIARGCRWTRAYLANTRDFYLGPLSETQVSAEERRALLGPVWQGRQKLKQVYRPGVDGQSEELVAEGFCLDVPLSREVEQKQ